MPQLFRVANTAGVFRLARSSQRARTVFGPTGVDKVKGRMVGHHTCTAETNQELHYLPKSHYTLDKSEISVVPAPMLDEERRTKE